MTKRTIKQIEKSMQQTQKKLSLLKSPMIPNVSNLFWKCLPSSYWWLPVNSSHDQLITCDEL